MSIEKLPTSASLKEVMDKFEEISFQDFSSIDVIASTDLPSEVKEGRIICATDTFNNIYIQEDINSISPKENDIFIATSSDNGKDFAIVSKNKRLNTKVLFVRKYVESSWVRIDGYIGINNTWELIEPRIFEVYKNGVLNSDAGVIEKEKFAGGTFDFSFGTSFMKIVASGRDSGSEQGSGHIYNTNLIDMSSYNNLDVTLEAKGDTYSSGYPTLNLKIRLINASGEVIATKTISSQTITSGTYPYLKVDYGVYSLDISNVNIPCKVSIYAYSSTSVMGYYSSTTKIHEITLN